uniref:Uncharacterized protein n=1 Tax=Hippocampus comes TaxID=109280 RepID=A0A3Q2Y8Q0_HIPCM
KKLIIIATLDRVLSKDDVEVCDASISLLEIEKVIQDLDNNNSPGRDGFITEFYKVPFYFNEGIVTLIYQKGEMRLLSNYSLISLLNIDNMILAKVL